MPDEEKQPWIKKSMTQHEAYRLDIAKYKKTNSYRDFMKQKREYKLKKLIRMSNRKDPNAPKRPAPAYILFTKKFRLDNPKLSAIEVARAAGKAWNVLGDVEKKEYTDAANAERENYKKLLVAYKKTAEYEAFREKQSKFKKANLELLMGDKETKNTKKTLKRKKRYRRILRKEPLRKRRRLMRKINIKKSRKKKPKVLSVVDDRTDSDHTI